MYVTLLDNFDSAADAHKPQSASGVGFIKVVRAEGAVAVLRVRPQTAASASGQVGQVRALEEVGGGRGRRGQRVEGELAANVR